MDAVAAKINRFIATSNEAASALGQDGTEVRNALVEAMELGDQIQVMELGLTAAQMIDMLRNYSFEKPQVLGEIELEESIIPEDVPIQLREATAKHAGEIWRVHQNDADPFPSNPHAHCLEQDLKLHLGSGDLYRRKKVVGSITRKNLRALRSKLGSKMPGVSFPPLQ
jgi:hypothetical protein